MSDDLRLTEPQINNRLFLPMVQVLEQELGAERVGAWVEEAGLPRVHLEDPEGWVSYAFVNAFERIFAREVLGLDELPGHDHPTWARWRRVGRRVLTADVAGTAWPVVRALGSPATFYRSLPQLARLGNRVARFQVSEVGRERATVVVRHDQEETPAGCWVRMGVLEQAPAIWGASLAEIDHPVCLHAGGDHCRYELRWQNHERGRLIRGLLAALVATGIGAGLTWLIGTRELAVWVGALAGLGAFAGWLWKRWTDESATRNQEALELRELLGISGERQQELWQERTELRRALLTNQKIAGFLAAELVEEIVSHPERELELGGHTVEAAVLFADIVGFTPRCEAVPAARIVEDLNTWFGVADPIISAHDGIIDKRIGDAIMMVFVQREGQSRADLSHRAVGCALELLGAVEACNATLGERGSRPFALRIGGAAGGLVLGNMGSPLKLEYTVIGDVVNQAARLEGHAAPGHVAVVASMADAAGLGREVARERVSVKGKREPLEVVTLAP